MAIAHATPACFPTVFPHVCHVTPHIRCTRYLLSHRQDWVLANSIEEMIATGAAQLSIGLILQTATPHEPLRLFGMGPSHLRSRYICEN